MMGDAFAISAQTTKAAVRGAGGVVAAQNRIAATVGADILRDGGNAVDAAVASAFALAVVEPWMSGLGGGGTMLVHRSDAGTTAGVDFGMMAPAALDPGDYPLTGTAGGDLFGWPAVVDDRNIHGPLAIAVPGSVDGLGLALERFGTMPLGEVMAPAVALARAGLSVDWYVTLLVANAAADLARYPSSAAIWLPGGLPPRADPAGAAWHLPLPCLADTLEAIARGGRRDAYEGEVGAAMLADLAALGSPIGREDLQRYAARIVDAHVIRYRGHRVATMPGLYAGVSLGEALRLLPEQPDLPAIAAALQIALGTRLAAIGDSPAAPASTTHISAIDRHGMAVALTHTLLSSFGSRLVLPRTGVLMNNGIMWFDPRPGRPNSLAPGRRPLSNMCPTIALTADGRTLALGASGGRKILPAVLQVLSAVLDDGMDLEAALARPRIDVSGTAAITVDARLPSDVRVQLEARGPIREVRPSIYPLHWACPVAVLRGPDGQLSGATEPMHPWADAVALA
jgi:gamma-glutamyltranspeptidase/glutathione hydrolase